MKPITDGLSYEQRQDLERRVPALRALRMEYLRLCEACAQAGVTGEDAEILEQKRRKFLQSMARKQREILKDNGIDPESVRSTYSCPLCRDTGVVIQDGVKRPCSCTLHRLKEQRNARFADFPRFSDFDEGLFSNAKQRASALRLRAFLEDYAARFPSNAVPHIHLYGNAGLGKTFFLRCLTQALHQRGVHAAYLTSYELFHLFRAQHMGEVRAMPRLKRADFLAVDDVGTEPMFRNITVEYFNELLDARMNAQTPMAIATNLDEIMLRERYGERIASRLHDQRRFAIIGLDGVDLRKK